MATQPTRDSAAAGSGATSERPAPNLGGALMYVDLDAEQSQLRQEEQWRKIGRNAMTLVKHPDLRILLNVMRAGTRIEEHRVDGRFAIHALSGRLRLHVRSAHGTETIEVPAGTLLAVDRMLPHDVEALEESAFLLWVSWTDDREG